MTEKTPGKKRLRRCKVCGKSFAPQRSTARYCSDACRKKAFRRRHPTPKVSAEPIAAPFTCRHCGRTTWQIEAHDRQYCSASCRTAAWKARRVAAALTLVELTPETSHDAAEMLIEEQGMRAIAATLKSAGYAYDAAVRQWIKGEVAGREG
ncbi:MAG: hypothetical protein L6Q98_23470 [Anaerolineae bacterium]|nr:hypothetical protein [Anaerolineae bacterium]NUQ06330.1 hypothetical protein [Anaerolineae bacterium]